MLRYGPGGFNCLQLASRGHHRVQARHGVSAVHSGSRHVLGVIFHNAR